ncbi:phosphatase PAP2 family protein [Sphingomonas bacterium]|uniref:phosphatase PAP2 family protein n=1 Tax=Sphingomonas bacterium TaxID=1895847 RepID=UPI0015750FB4|nr:phosphatase PAP2 family protein [Sphingomonas bacterium]
MRRPNQAERADLAIARAAAAVHRSAPVRALGWVSELADQPQLISICCATLGSGMLLRDRRLARAGARMLAAELLATELKNLVKHRIDRTRPTVIAGGGRYWAGRGDDPAHEMTSFPSGHTAGAVAVAGAIARSYPAHRAAAFGTAAAIGAIQVPRCTHFVSDVGAGAVVGLVAAQAVAIGETLGGRALAPVVARLWVLGRFNPMRWLG